MADLPFPITGTAKQQTELMMRLWEEMFEERVGGGYVGDVFEIDSDDVLSINISSTGGLTKSGNELAILNNPTGGLSSTADGERVKLKTGGGLSTDADGLYIADAYYSFGQVDCPAGTDPNALLPADTLTLANGTGISISGNSTTNTVTIAVSGVVLDSVYDANTILKADADNTPEALTVAEQTLVGRITGGEITALSASQVRTLLDVPTNAEAVLDSLFDANTILKADADNTPEALTVGEGTIVGRAAGGEITALDNVTRGHREGLLVTIKDADELYVSGGTIEINGTVYESEAQLTVSLSGVSANTLYYLYVNAPASGLTLTATEITVSATAPTFDDARGAYYKTADATKRLLAKYYQAGGNLSLSPLVDADDGRWGDSLFGPNKVNASFGSGTTYSSFYRFPNFTAQPGDTISSAIVTLTCRNIGDTGTCNVNCYFNAADNASAPTNYADAEGLALTSGVAWSVPNISVGQTYTSPDLATPLQEVISRSGWAYNNAVMAVIRGASGVGWRGTYDIYDAGGSYIAVLAVVINALGVSKVIDDRRVGIGMDSGNAPNDGDVIQYDSTLGEYKALSLADAGITATALYDANTILKADDDNTPEALTVGEGTIVGRAAGGEITALTKAQVLGLLDLDDVLETKRITTPAATNLTIDPTGDLVLDPAGNDILPGTGYDLTLGSLTKKFLAFHAAELFVETLVAQDTMATIGGRIIVAPTTMLTSDVAAGDTTIYCKHNSLASGDIVYLESGGNVEFVSIDSAPGGAGPYSYSVTRNLDGTGANTWSAGDAVLNTGATGDGFIDLYSVAGMIAGSTAGPTIVGNVRTGAIYTDIEPRWAIGNLNGLYGYATDIYGAAFGSPDAAWLKIDPTNGVRIGHNATTSIQLDASGNVTVAGDITATSGYFQTVTLGKTGTASGTLVLQLNDGGGDTYVAYGKTDFTNTDAGFILGIDDSDGNKGKVYIGDSGTYLNWDGAGLAIKGSITLTGGSGWANLTDAPTDLADINATEGSKLSGIATGADVTLSAINGGLTVTGGGITLSSGGAIKGGQTDYATGTGFFLGYSGSAYKFSIGSSTKYITWDGSTLAVGGDIIATGNIAANAATQVYAAFTATQVEFASANEVTVQTTSSVNIPAAATGAVVVVSASVEFDKITSFGNVCTVTVKIKRASTVLGTYYVTLTTPNVGTMFNATLTDTPGSKGDYDYTITCDPDVYYKNWGYANRSLICTVHKK